MAYLATCRNGASGLTTSIVRILPFVVLSPASSGVNAGSNISPSAVVHGLLLTPKEISIGVFIEVRSDLESLC